MTPHQLPRLQRLTYRVWLAVGVLVLGAVAFLLLARPLAVVLAPAVVALLIVYLLNPVVTALEQRGVPRLLGTLLAYLAVVAVVVAASALLLPLLSAQLASFAAEAPDLGATLRERLGEVLGAVGLQVDLEGLLDTQALGEQFSDFVASEENRSTLSAILAAASGFARSAFTVVFGLTVGPVVAFYVLADLPSMLASVRRVVPPDRRAEIEEVASELATVVGGFVRGQLIIAVFVGVATTVALGVVQLPYYLVIGVIAGVTNLIPLLGPFVAGVLGVTVALVTDGVGYALLVMALMTGIQQLESSLLSPLIMGRVVHIHPLAVLLGVLIAAALYGVFGMLVVVPLIAGAKVLALHLWRTRVPWAQEDDASGPAPPPDATAGLGSATSADTGSEIDQRALAAEASTAPSSTATASAKPSPIAPRTP